MSTVTTDPIADMLTRIRNAVAVRKQTVFLPHSNAKESIARLLQQNKFIDTVASDGTGVDKKLVLTIFDDDSNPKITEIVRLSKPGRRQYVKASNIPVVKRGRGLVIISTSNGVMTGDEARKQGVGGELICKVY